MSWENVIPKFRLAKCLTPYPFKRVPCHMLTMSNNHGGNLTHGTLDHDMVIIYHGVAHSKSRTKQKIKIKINHCSI